MRRVILPFLAPLALLAVAACAPTEPTGSPDPLAEIEMTTDAGYLTAEEREVVDLLMQASDLMSEIYKHQRIADYDAVRAQVEAAGDPAKLALFDRYFGPWDEMNELAPFWGGKPMPEGAGFYPADLTREEFDTYLAAHPEQKQRLLDPYTVVKRGGEGFVAVPYSVEYREWLEPAAKLLEQAAAKTTNASLKKFLTLRAAAFRSDDYYDSELAWMDLADTPIEIAIGPYETYTDRLYGAKTAFESFVTLKDPEESAALAHYKDLLADMEKNLPIDDRYKNFQRGFESPIVVADQIKGGGDNVPGIQTIAFNLPNDERVREAKGAKKVILRNVLGAKYDAILVPIGRLVLSDDQAALVSRKYFQDFTLFHELSHSLGPGSIVVDGRKTTVDAELKEQHAAIEEAKADVMGMWNILYLMQRGELPAAEKPQLFATYFAGLFRSVRFGIVEAHGQGNAMQYGYLLAKGAFRFDEDDGHYVIDPARMETGLRDLLRDILMLQATGDYAGTKAFLAEWARLDQHADAAIAKMGAIPVDILPKYPDRI